MAGKKREKLRQSDVGALKMFDVLAPYLERLHDEGCQRDKAGNRTLHFEQYCMLVLLSFFNPSIRSLRAIQQASELANVQKRLGVSRASLGSLSEATQVFDPERLIKIIEELGAELRPLGRDPRLKNVPFALTLVDGSLLAVLPRMAQASLLKKETGSGMVKWRLHTQFEIDNHVPMRIDVTEGSGRGDTDERDVLEKHLQSERCYVMDRGYSKFKLFNSIHAANSNYVCRIRDNSYVESIACRLLTDEDRAAGIISDEIANLGHPTSGTTDRMDHQVRVICISVKPHPKRGKTGGGTAGPPSDGVLRIVTDMMDVPAAIIALIYRYRWTIEIFFRFFKHILGCQHLLSRDEAGIQIQTYCAIIACMLLNLWSGRKPTRRTYEMICHYLSGWASEEELFAHLAKLKPTAEKKS